MTTEKLLTTAELARELQVKPRTISLWVKLGKIPFFRVNEKCIRFYLTEVLAALRKEPQSA